VSLRTFAIKAYTSERLPLAGIYLREVTPCGDIP
jgi:hypothetical protein